MRKDFISSCLFSVLLLCGCASFAPDAAVPRPEKFPEQFSREDDISRIATGGFQMYADETGTAGKWWKNFESGELNSLIDEAISENFSIREALSRLLQARYLAVKAGAAKFPEVNLQGGVAHTEQDNGLSSDDLDEWSLGLSAGYEVDLWGRIQAEKRSDKLGEQASREDLKTAMMSVAAQVAESWLDLISNRKQQRLFERQAKLQKQLLQLITLRFSQARSTALDIYQQQQAIEKIEEGLIPLRANEKVIKRRIALLLGRADLEESRLMGRDFPAIRAIPDTGLPADLLASRPDIRAAGLRLKSSEWEIAAARADRLPALKLTASHVYSSDQLSSLFDNWLTNLAANLAGPIFDGYRRRAEVERVRAVTEERLAVYYRTVFAAVQEVENAITEETRYLKTVKSLRRQLNISEKTIREARTRYLNGSSDFLNVLREELNVLQVRQDLILTEQEMIKSRIRLHLALGGGWVDDYASEAFSSALKREDAEK